jgi:hypothetical protein
MPTMSAFLAENLSVIFCYQTRTDIPFTHRNSVLSKIKRKSNFQTVIGQDRQTDKRNAASPSFSPFFTLALKPPLSEKKNFLA